MKVHGKEFSQFKHNWFMFYFESFQIFAKLSSHLYSLSLSEMKLKCTEMKWRKIVKGKIRRMPPVIWTILNLPLWIKNSGSIANIWTFENKTIASIYTDSIFDHFWSCILILLYMLFSLSTPNTLFFHIFLHVYLYWRAIILENP